MVSFASKHNDPKANLSWSERIGYGMGNYGLAWVNGIMSAFFMLYLTNVAVLDAGVVGTIIAVSKVFDGVSDLIMGGIVDRTKSKHGKARIWLLRMRIPMAIASLLLFCIPASLTTAVKYVYVFIMYNLVNSVFYTSMYVPYTSMNYLMTENAYDRGLLGNMNMIFQTLANITMNTFFLKWLNHFGAGDMYVQSAWTKTFVVFGFVSIAAFLCTFFGTKERVRANETGEQKVEENVPFVTGIKALFQNKYWIMMTGMLALFFLMYSVNGGATVYYAKDILGDKNLVSTINGIFNIVQILGMFFIAMLVKKFGKRNVFSLGLILDIIGMLVLNFSGGSMPIIVVSSVIRGIGNACGGATMWAMVSDTIDYGEWKTGYRTEGLVNSACSFGYKIGNGIGSALLGVILEVGGYVGNAAAQTASALTSIKICFVWIPIAVYVCGLIIMKFYHLDKEFDGILADLKARK